MWSEKRSAQSIYKSLTAQKKVVLFLLTWKRKTKDQLIATWKREVSLCSKKRRWGGLRETSRPDIITESSLFATQVKRDPGASGFSDQKPSYTSLQYCS
jgi:hypothetical protein